MVIKYSPSATVKKRASSAKKRASSPKKRPTSAKNVKKSAKKNVKKSAKKSAKKPAPIVKKAMVDCDAICQKAKEEMMDAHKNIISSMTDDASRQKAELARLQEKLDEKDNKLRLCGSSKVVDDSEVKKLQKTLKEKEDILQKIEEKLKSQQSDFDKHLKKEVSDAVERVKNEYKTSMEQLRSQLSECTKAGGLCESERSELKALRASFEQELKRVKEVHLEEIKLCKLTNEIYHGDKNVLQKKLKEKEEAHIIEMKELRGGTSEKERELADIINEYRQDNADLERKRGELQKEREEFQKIRQQFENDHAEFKKERAAFEKSVKTQNAPIVIPTAEPTTQPPRMNLDLQSAIRKRGVEQDVPSRPPPSQNDLMAAIRGGAALKKTTNKDADDKPIPRPSLLSQIQSGIKLKSSNKDAKPITKSDNALLTKIKEIGKQTKSEEVEEDEDEDESWKFSVRQNKKTKKSVRKSKKTKKSVKKSKKTKKSVRKTKSVKKSKKSLRRK